MNIIEKSRKTPSARDTTRVSMRIPPDLLAKLQECARIEGITVNEFIVRSLKNAILAYERGIPTAPLAPLVTTIRIDDEETCRQLTIEAAAICHEPAALIPELVRLGLKTWRDLGLQWALPDEEQVKTGRIASFRR